MADDETESLKKQLIDLRNEIYLLRHQLAERDHQLAHVEREQKLLVKEKQLDQKYREKVALEEKNRKEQEELGLKNIREHAAWVVYATPSIICGLAPDGTVRFLNPACIKMTGYDVKELLGKNWWSLLYPADLFPQVEKLYLEFRKGDVNGYEMTLATRDGQKRTVAYTSINHLDDQGKIAEIVLVGIDITARRRAEALLEESENKFRTLTANIPAAVYRCKNDPQWTMIHISNFIEEIAGYTAWDLIDNRTLAFVDVIHPEDREYVYVTIQDALEKKQPYILEYKIQHANKSIRWVHEKGQGCFGPKGELICLDGAIFDITERKEMEKKLQEALVEVKNLSLTDELTQLYNRRGFITHAEQQLKIADRSKRPLSILFVDLNGMKTINDKLGHKMGDLALVETAGLMRQTFRRADIIARMGGDEFAVLAVDITLDEAATMCRRLQEGVTECNRLNKLPFELSLSVGTADYDPKKPCSLDKMLETADQKMYAAKQKMYAERKKQG